MRLNNVIMQRLLLILCCTVVPLFAECMQGPETRQGKV